MVDEHTIRTTLPPTALLASRLKVERCSLHVTDGPDTGQQLDPLGSRTIVGRDPWCDLVLDDPRVSGQHMEIQLGDGEIRVRDLGSTNGSWCGGMRVVEVLVDGNATIRVGNSTLELRRGEGKRVLNRSPFDPTGKLIGTSPAMQNVFDMMERIAPLHLAVVLLGETGTGKSAIARAMHELGPRKSRKFVSINCGALPPDLVESTLFGHVKGAFTGAHRDAAGIFEQADGGSVLLDEIGEMPLELQPKLLQVLETRRVRRVGSDREVEVDFRLFSATNRPLAADVDGGRFRRDLYYRLAGIELTLPALRDRHEDLPLLAQLFLGQHAERAGRGHGAPDPLHGIGDEAVRMLQAYAWPGNVRELDNVISRAVALTRGPWIGPEDLLFTSWQSQPELDARDAGNAVVPPSGHDTVLDARAVESNDGELPLLERTFKEFKAALLAEHERAYFQRLLERSEGNLSRAARIADISRTYLTTMVRKYALRGDP